MVWEVDRTRISAVHILASVLLTNRKNVTQVKIKRAGTYLVGHKLVLVVWAVRMSWKVEGHIKLLEDHKMSNFRHHWEAHMIRMAEAGEDSVEVGR